MTQTIDASCPDCGEALPARDVARMTLPTPFLVVGYGALVGEELIAIDTLTVDAYGMTLPDGRALTWPRAGREPVPPGSAARLFPGPLDAAAHWGGELLWPEGGRLRLRHECLAE